MDFDKDYRDKRAYYNVDPACHIVNVSEQYSPDDIHGSGLKIEKQALLSDGIPCNIEIPYFQNNEFDQFTFCGLFTFFNTTSADDMGLVFNGEADDCYPGSITIRLTSDRRVLAGIQTAQGNFGIINQQRVSILLP